MRAFPRLSGTHGRQRGIPTILLMIDELEVGGAERQILHLAKGLNGAGLRTQVLYFRPECSAMAPDFHAAGIEPIVVKKRRAVDLAFFYRLWRRIKEMRPVIVQTYAPTADLWGRAAAWLSGVPLIVTSGRNTRMPWTMRLLDPVTTAFVANSAAVRDQMIQKRGIAADRISVIPNGVDMPECLNRREAPNDPPVIGTACRLVRQKNVRCLLQAVGLLRDRGRLVRVEIAGSGPLWDSLRAFCRHLRLEDRVEFLGERGDMPALLARWDAAVLPSWHEGLSNFLMEAMVAGVPVVASDIPENRALLCDGKAGLLFPPHDAHGLADALWRLVNDRELSRGMSDVAKRVISEYSVEAMVSMHLTLYKRLLGVTA